MASMELCWCVAARSQQWAAVCTWKTEIWGRGVLLLAVFRRPASAPAEPAGFLPARMSFSRFSVPCGQQPGPPWRLSYWLCVCICDACMPDETARRGHEQGGGG